ncbi:hypothetical protein UFOVP122_64 [uncultured Caudovirales phage]|uniref:Uncharacterized protein n=1 Tax=uncultured Caudovirales phage TaxID=2100421 RepID=A0A6J5LDI8_9CAUD|nr:hypothetical protein UFOVP122_64 [uncultured Caudovirales phage]
MDPIIKHGWHWSFGWLRRPEYDEPDWYCYEEPDGDMWLSTLPFLYLDLRRDKKTGELYTTRAPIPKRPMKYDTSAKSAASRRNAKG